MNAPDIEIQARSTNRDVWLRPHSALDDERVALGETDGAIPAFTRLNSGKRAGDLIWTGGSFIKIASPRLVDLLGSIHATGFKTFDVDLPDELSHYRGLGVTGRPGEHDLGNPGDGPFWSIVISTRLDEALSAAGVVDFERRKIA